MAHEDFRGMTVDVSVERLLAAVLHLDRPLRDESKQTAVHLQADVFASAERAADAAQRESHALERQTEARGDLFLVFVQPLRRDEQLDTRTVVVGQGESRLEPEECLVLHADFVGAFDHYVANEVLVTANHALAADDVAIRVNRRERSVDCRLGVDERREHFVVDFDCRERAPRSLGMISCNSRHGFAGVSHNVAREHRLVARDEAVGQLAGHVVGVITAETPLMASAADTSMETMRACGCGLRNVAPQSMLSAHASEEKAKRPCTLGMPSGRSAEVPSPSRMRESVRVFVRVAMSADSVRHVSYRPNRAVGLALRPLRQRCARSRCSGRCCR